MLGQKIKMAKRTYLKFVKGCQVKTIKKTGQSVRVTMKCPKRLNNKIKSAQDLVNSS